MFTVYKWIIFVNLLTIIRFIGTIFYFQVNQLKLKDIFIITLIFSTDFFDGYIARKKNAATKYGMYLDQWIDKIVFVVFYYILIKNNRISDINHKDK